MPQMQRSIKDVPKTTLTARFSTTPNQVRTRRSPIPTNSGMIPSMRTARFVALFKLRESAGLV